MTGKTVGENIRSAQCHNPDVIRPVDNPLMPQGGTVILYGNLAPDGAVLKQTAASPRLMQHTGRAVVFEDHHDLMERLDDPDLDVDENCVMVLKNGGPIGAPGMPEVGKPAHPRQVAQARRRRHGAHQRCAHERHQLWNGGAARLAGIGRWRAAGDRPNG